MMARQRGPRRQIKLGARPSGRPQGYMTQEGDAQAYRALAARLLLGYTSLCRTAQLFADRRLAAQQPAGEAQTLQETPCEPSEPI